MKTQIEICGLWERRDKNGNIYFTGPFGNANVMIFPNAKRTADNQPNYRLVIVPKAIVPKPQTDSINEPQFPVFGDDEVPF